MMMPLPISSLVGKPLFGAQTSSGATLQIDDCTPATAEAEMVPEKAATTGVKAKLAVRSSVVTMTNALSLSPVAAVQAASVLGTASSNSLQNSTLEISTVRPLADPSLAKRVILAARRVATGFWTAAAARA